jgi:hypothetical protein
MRPDHRPQSGHARALTPERAETTIAPSCSATSSTTNPAGIKDDSRMLFAMVLILLANQHNAATQNHQM